MAEFQEVVKSYKRMCDSYETCEGCPMLITEIARSVAHCRYTVLMEPGKAENLITKWAEEHPIVTNRMKFREVFGMDLIVTEDNSKWLDEEYKEK